RSRHTRFSRDWSSDVCSSDLIAREILAAFHSLCPERKERPQTGLVGEDIFDGEVALIRTAQTRQVIRCLAIDIDESAILQKHYSLQGRRYFRDRSQIVNRSVCNLRRKAIISEVPECVFIDD